MPAKALALTALSLAALRGPIHRSNVRFETPAEEPKTEPATPPAPVTPAPAAPAAPAPAAPAPTPAPAATAPKPSPMQQLRGALSERGALVAERDLARRELSAAASERDSLRTQLTAANARILGYEQREAAHQQAALELANDRKEFDQFVSDGVLNQQAALGAPAATLPASSPVGQESPEEIFAQFDQLKGKAKTAYYNKHEAVLSKPRPKSA